MYISYPFGDLLAFIFEKRNKAYVLYGDVNIAKEKDNKAQKDLRYMQVLCMSGRAGA